MRVELTIAAVGCDRTGTDFREPRNSHDHECRNGRTPPGQLMALFSLPSTITRLIEEIKMAAVAESFSESLGASSEITPWCQLLLEHLEEFARLVWYLVADEKLVEETFARSLEQLDAIPFEVSDPVVACNQLREILITQAIVVVEMTRKKEAEGRSFPTPLGDLPDLPRLAFLLRMVIRSPAAEVAKFLNVTPSEARRLVAEAIGHLSVASFSTFTEGFRGGNISDQSEN
jgi:hypothetical protein